MEISDKQFQKFMALSDEEVQQSKDQYSQQMALQQRALDQADEAAQVSKSVADKQIQAMDQNMGFAQEDRQRYKDVALPLQDAFIKQANEYDSPQRQAEAAAQALADNQQQLEAQRAATAGQLASMGVDPSQVMSTSLANQIGVAGAAMGAQNANNARQQVQQQGLALRESAINMTNGLPAQSQAGYATATNAANSAAANTNAATSGYGQASGIGATAAGIRQNSLNTASSITGSPMAWASLGNQSYGGASNGIMNASSIQNQMFQNNMSVQKMKDDQSAQTMNAIGSAAGMAAMFMAEGGAVDDYHFSPDAVHVDDIRFHPTGVTAHAAKSGMSTTDKVRGGLAIAGGALSAMGSGGGGGGGEAADPNLGQTWLHPVYRAEGGPIPSFSGGAPAPRPYQAYAPQLGMGGGMAPAPRQASMGAMQRPMMRPTMRPMGGMGRAPTMFAEGGATASPQYQVMPNIQSRDKIPAELAPGEVVIPADVVRIKGQEFFDKLINKHHRPGS